MHNQPGSDSPSGKKRWLAPAMIGVMVGLAIPYPKSVVWYLFPPAVRITQVPRVGSGGPEETTPISGEVSGWGVSGARVVLYAFTEDGWYVQPYTENPITEIGPDGKWSNETHLGQSYAAVLVGPSFKPKDKLSSPPQPGGNVLAITVCNGGSASDQSAIGSRTNESVLLKLAFGVISAIIATAIESVFLYLFRGARRLKRKYVSA